MPAERVWPRWILALAVAVQLAVLYDPRVPSAGGLAGVPGLDKVVHLVVFAAVMVVARRSGLRTWLVLALTVVHAPVSEILQATLLPHRSGDWHDVVADLCGCALGWWLTRHRS